MDEVGRTLGAEHTRGAGRSGRIEPYDYDVLHEYSGLTRRQLQPLLDLRETDLRPLFGPCRVLAQALDEKVLFLTDECVVDGCSAKVYSSDYFHVSVRLDEIGFCSRNHRLAAARGLKTGILQLLNTRAHVLRLQ